MAHMKTAVLAAVLIACSDTGAGSDSGETGDGGVDATPDVSVDARVDATLDASPVDGACGPSANEGFAAAPSANLCASGAPSTVTGTGPWSWSCAGSFGGKSATCTALAVPSEVVAAGYLVHTFASTFDATTVDTAESKASGFDWYVWNLFSQADASKVVLNGDHSVTLMGDPAGPNGEIVTAARTGATTYVGTAFGGGAYFEAVFKFDPATVVAAGFKGWPSWWSLPLDHAIDGTGTWWNGDAGTGYDNHIEPDFFEYDIQGSPPNRYGGTLHNWYGAYKSTCSPSSYCDWHTPSSVNLRTAPPGTDFTNYHAVGFLWVPATAASPGSATYFFDRVAIGATTTWTKWVDQPIPVGVAPPSPQPPWAISWMDREHYLLVLGTGVGEPMTIQRVDVWQASALGNMHQ